MLDNPALVIAFRYGGMSSLSRRRPKNDLVKKRLDGNPLVRISLMIVGKKSGSFFFNNLPKPRIKADLSAS
jgi:hypothetical protein